MVIGRDPTLPGVEGDENALLYVIAAAGNDRLKGHFVNPR